MVRLWLTSLILVYAPLMSACAGAFVCMPGVGGESVLVEDSAVLCSSDEHATAKIVAAVVLVLLGLVVPITIIRQIRRLRSGERLHDVEMLEAYGTLYEGYTLEWARFEALALVRKAWASAAVPLLQLLNIMSHGPVARSAALAVASTSGAWLTLAASVPG